MGQLFSSHPPITTDHVDLSHFTFHRVLGKGGFGTVSVVEHSYNPSTVDTSTSRLFACKCIHKYRLVKNGDALKSTFLERNVGIAITQQCQQSIIAQFTVPLYHCFQTPQSLYVVSQFVNGGDLRYYMQQCGTITNELQLKQYAAELIVALSQLHYHGIVYRDLKPENILIDEAGHLVLTDLGLCAEEKETMNILPSQYIQYRGTLGYIAPEVLYGLAYSHTVDYYALGCTLFELMHGSGILPHSSDDYNETGVVFTCDMSDACVDFVTRLLHTDVRERLGATSVDELKFHAWFDRADWSRVEKKQLPTYYTPQKDVANCDYTFELEEQLVGDVELDKSPAVTTEQQLLFAEWDYNTKLDVKTQQQLLAKQQRAQRSLCTKLSQWMSSLWKRTARSQRDYKRKTSATSYDSHDALTEIVISG